MPVLGRRVVDFSQRVGLKASRTTTRVLSRAESRPDLIRLGSAYGGWWVPADLFGPGSICYLAGVGEDVTFDLALVERFGCLVWAFDPTPRAQAHAGLISEPKFHFLPRGLWSVRTTMRFYAPRDASHVSHSITNIQRTSAYFEADCWTVLDLMRDLGHGHLDLLKLDIEGAEGPVLEAMLRDGIRPTTLCVEFDAAEPPWTTLRRIRDVRRAGYLLVHVEGRNYVFVVAGSPDRLKPEHDSAE